MPVLEKSATRDEDVPKAQPWSLALGGYSFKGYHQGYYGIKGYYKGYFQGCYKRIL